MFKKIKKIYQEIVKHNIDQEDYIEDLKLKIEQLKQSRVSDIAREQLKGIEINLDYLDEMKQNERKDFLSQAELIHTNKAFNKIINNI